MADDAILLDTCTFIDWALGARVGKKTLPRLEQGAVDGRLYLSPLSVQEVMRLAEKGRLELLPTATSWVRRALRTMRVAELPYTSEAALEAGALTDVNGDPVDRALLGAAIALDLTLATRDADLLGSGARRAVRMLDSRS